MIRMCIHTQTAALGQLQYSGYVKLKDRFYRYNYKEKRQCCSNVAKIFNVLAGRFLFPCTSIYIACWAVVGCVTHALRGKKI